jgi:hypothetical protein
MDPREQQAEPQTRLRDRRQALRRLRWRLRGAWQWPAFVVLTAVDAVVLVLLPAYAQGPGGIFPALLVAGFANLLAVALLAPVAGRLLRRRRPDLPVVVAGNYAGTALLVAFAALLVAGGIAHRPAAGAEARARRAVLFSVHEYVLRQAPALRGRIGATDTLRVEPGLYRACVPTRRSDRWMCLFVTTDQSPPGVTRDPGAEPNSDYRAGDGLP